MLLKRMAVVVVAATVSLALLVAPALAADPPLVPANVTATITFDSSVPGNTTLTPVTLTTEPLPWAHWGRTTSVRRGTTGYGLWCAGTQITMPYVLPTTFWPLYPYYGQKVQQTNEPVKLSLTTPVRLMQRDLSGAAVSNIVVQNSTGTITYVKDDDYTVTTDSESYTLIARKTGTTIANGQTVNVSYRWPTSGTRGQAIIDLPELANYYESWVAFYYNMPSVGYRDQFTLHWYDPSDPNAKETIANLALTSSTEWRRVPSGGTGLELSDGNTVSLSRTAGELMFQFFEIKEGGLEVPKNGQGPAIDDISFVGYMYGPVRSLDASVSGSTILVNWDKPYAAKGSTTTDSRSIEYLVWRADGQGPSYTWSQLTPSKISSTSFVDSTAVAGQTYTYLVQAREPAAGTGYGQAQMATGRLASVGVDVAASVLPTTLVNSGNATFSYLITNTSDTYTLTGISVGDTISGSPTVPQTSLAPGESMTATHAGTFSTTTQNTVTVSGTSNSTLYESQDAVSVTVIHPAVSLATAPAQQVASAGKQADFEATIENTGDVTVTGLSIRVDDVEVASLTSLAAGASTVVPFTVTAGSVAGSIGSHDIDVAYDYDSGVSGSSTSNTTQVAVEVADSRIAEADRYATAVSAADAAFSSASAVVIATGQDFPDALSAGALAGTVDGPLLLVKRDSVSQAVLDEINKLGATKVYAVGGTGVISDSVISTIISKTSVVTSERKSGANRYDTASQVATRVEQLAGDVDTVFLATGQNFPDALAASSLAANQSWPTLLTKTSSLPAETAAALASIKPARVVICGGTGAVSSAVESAISGNAAYGSPTVIRMAGSSRYDTAKQLIEWAVAQGLEPDTGIDGVYLATGTAYPDALAGGVLAGIGRPDGAWRPLMLTKPTSLVSEASAIIGGYDSVNFVTVLGGTAAVSDTVRLAALRLLP